MKNLLAVPLESSVVFQCECVVPAKQESKDMWHINRDRNGTAICASFCGSGAVTESLCVCCVVKT